MSAPHKPSELTSRPAGHSFGAAPCSACGCLGNCSCGHEPLDLNKCCTLDQVGVCACCRKRQSAKFKTIVADPPWKLHRPGAGGKSSRPLEYPTMSIDEIAAMPIGELADEVCHLYLWTVSRHLRRSYEVADAWGFDTSHATVLVWCKPPRGWECGGHYGLTTEYVLFCRRGIEGRNPEVREPRSWWEWPRGRHSEKPDAFFDMVERISPSPRLELFARTQRLGWASWGNEALNHVEMPND